MAQVKNQSEHMFVEWALDIQAENYDVEQVANLLNGLGVQQLTGLDVGGGIGRYAQLVCDRVPGCRMIVLDKSELAEEAFVDDARLQLQSADYFTFEPGQRYDFLIFKTVLHHFIGESETETTELQQSALRKARQLLKPGGLLLIEENFYEGMMQDDLPGRIIFAITRQKWIEDLVRKLGANTAGEGVRFRAYGSWKKMLEQEGFELRSLARSPTWGRTWPLWQRLPLLSAKRFQGVLEVRASETFGAYQPTQASISQSSGFFAPITSGSFAMRVRDLWHATSVRARYFFALIALTGPLTITTCAMSET